MAIVPTAQKLMLQDILPPGFTAKQYKLHVARVSPDGENPPSIYRSGDWDTWVGWHEWSSGRDDWSRPRIFSVMQVERGGSEWVFGGCFKVVERHKNGYVVHLIDDITERLIGRLTLRFHDKSPGRARYLENRIGNMEVVEVASQVLQGGGRVPWTGQNQPLFAELQVVVRLGQSDWKHVLQEMKGVYVWNDRATGSRMSDRPLLRSVESGRACRPTSRPITLEMRSSSS